MPVHLYVGYECFHPFNSLCFTDVCTRGKICPAHTPSVCCALKMTNFLCFQLI